MNAIAGIPVTNDVNRCETTIRVSEELQRQNDRLQLLLNLTTRITSSLDLREVLRVIAANIREVIHADAVTVSLPDASSGKFRVFAMDFPRGKGVIKEELLVMPSAAAKQAMEDMKPVVFDVRERAELAPEPYDVAAAEGVRIACLIPLVNRGRALGILSILRTTETLFTPEDVEFLSRASGQIAIAVENSLAFHRVSGLGDRLQLLLNLTANITSSLDLKEVLRTIAANIRGVMHSDAVAVSLIDAASEQFRVFAMDFPHGKGVIKEELFYTPSAAAKKAMDTQKPVVLDTREPDNFVYGTTDIAAAEGIKALCLIPLINRGRVLGILATSRTTETPFTPKMLISLAGRQDR